MIEIAFVDASFAKLQQYGALVEFEMTRHKQISRRQGNRIKGRTN